MIKLTSVLIIYGLIITLYFMPTIIAVRKKHASKIGLFFLNLFLGWTLLGWVVAFVWAFSSPRNIIINNTTPQSISDEISKLSALKDKGMITEEEFNSQKQMILSSECVN